MPPPEPLTADEAWEREPPAGDGQAEGIERSGAGDWLCYLGSHMSK